MGPRPHVKMQKTQKIRWEVEEGRGPSRWKRPEEVAATAWEREIVVQ